MPKYKTVEQFLEDLEENKKSQVIKLREIVLSANSDLTEHIKWNAPSYIYKGEDRITFNLMNKQGLVKLVFHMGALRKENRKATPILLDKFAIIEWVSDIRGYITFRDLEDVLQKEEAVRELVGGWLVKI